MLLPTRKLLILLALPVPVLAVWPAHVTLALAVGYDIAILIAAWITVWISPRVGQIVIERSLPPHLSLGTSNSIGWNVRNIARMPLKLELTEGVPSTIDCNRASLQATLRPNSYAELRYEVRPTRRGLFEFGDIFLRWEMQFGLVMRQRKLAAKDSVKVYPNVASLARYELAAQRHRTTEIGLSPAKLRGRGSMFESLREYVPGDDPADIAWKATARHHRLITRNYELERSQNMLLLLDCGRLMIPAIEKLSRLDYAINASLLLTYVAMKQGDNIGMVAFSDQIESYVPLAKGRAALSQMNEALYRLEAKPREPNYEQVCRFLALRHRKRSLVVALTDVVDKNASAPLLSYMAHFTRYHLPLCVTLRNLEIERLAAAEPETPADCFTKAEAIKLLNRRTEALTRMRQSGVDILDVDPRCLTPQLLQRYITLKMQKRF